jgi:hypothetical protein
MMICNKFIQWIKDPLGVQDVVHHINSKASELQGDILHSHKRQQELVKAFMDFDKRFEEFVFFKAVEEGLDSAIPDMLWAKDIYGRYVVANKAIREGLLFDNHPRGKTDSQLAQARKKVVGNANHTFGEMCGDSDKLVLEKEHPITIVEEGIVTGERLVLKVHKNVLKNAIGAIIGTVGVAKDITNEYCVLEDIRDTTSCEDTKAKIDALLKANIFVNKDV